MSQVFTAGQLKSIVERIERLEEEKVALTKDIGEVYSEARDVGFDTKILRQAIRLRKLEAYAVLDLYLSALGMRQ